MHRQCLQASQPADAAANGHVTDSLSNGTATGALWHRSEKSHLQVLNGALAGDDGLHEEACMHRPHVMMCEAPFPETCHETLSCKRRQPARLQITLEGEIVPKALNWARRPFLISFTCKQHRDHLSS